MASPFAVFRRNQKVLLAIVGIGAMVAFVFLDPLMRFVGRSRRQENPVVVETKYGKLKESDMQAMRASRELVALFLQRVAAETINAQVRNGGLDSRYFDLALQRWSTHWHQTLMGRSTDSPEEATIETLVLSKKAQQLGIVVSDRAINDLLKQVSDDSLTGETLEGIISGLQSGRRVSATRLFEAIRTEMLASKVCELFARGINDIPPAQRFEYFCRLNRRAKVDLAPLAVSDFVGQVSDPNAQQVQGFYDKYKDQYAEPASPTPGFKEPKRATFQYFKADFAKFKDEFAPQVSEAEIADYYEKNKEQFRAVELPTDQAQPSDKPAEEPTDAEASKSEESKPDDSKPESKPGDAASDADVKENKSDKPGAAKETSDNDKSSDAKRSAPFRLVSTALDEPPATDQSAPPSIDAPANKSDGNEKSADEAPAVTEKPADKPAEEAASDGAKQDEPGAETKPEAPKYEPLEKVSEQIRSSIAARKASDRIGEIFDELTAEMKRHADDVDAYNARKGSDQNTKPPKTFPFAELAKAKGVEAKELPQVSAAEAAHEDLGKLQQRISDPRSPLGMRLEPFVLFAFGDNFPTYRPEVLQDNEGNGYLFWKTEQTPAYLPPLDQVRDKVVRAWKMIKARELARTRADEYAALAREGAKPLKEAFANQPNLKVAQTDWFSWLTIGSVPFDEAGNRPRLSRVEGVEHAGTEFMEDVFKLAPGDVGVTANQPQDTIYVVRLDEYEKPIDELRQDFASDRRPIYMAAALPEQRQIYATWLKDVEHDAGVHWLRQADIHRRGRAVDAEPEPEPESDDDF